MSARWARRSRKRSAALTRRSTASNGRMVFAGATSAGRRWNRKRVLRTNPVIPDDAQLAQLSYAGLTRVSIQLQETLAKKMDCRVKPGNDTFFLRANHHPRRRPW